MYIAFQTFRKFPVMEHELRFQKGFPEYRRLRSFERDMWAADEDAELKVYQKNDIGQLIPHKSSNCKNLST